MSIVEAAKQACEAIRPKPGETAEQLAERLYNAQQEAYDRYAGYTLCGEVPLCLQAEAVRAGWLRMAKEKLSI